MTPVVCKPIPIRDAWLVRESIRIYNPAQNRYQAAPGYVFTVRFSTSRTGFASDGTTPSTIGDLGPFPLVESAIAGTYYFEVSSNVLTLRLLALVGQLIYQIIEGGPASEVCVVQPLLVEDPGYATP